MGSLSLTASKLTQRRGFGPFMPGTYHAPYADCYRCPVGLHAGDVRGRVPRFIEEQLFVHLVVARRSRGDRRRADPGRGRLRRRRPTSFLQRLRELTTQHGILLIVDEVQSGMGRTGQMFAIEHAGVEPDIVTIAKGIASGLPLGVATARVGRHDVAARRARQHVRRQPGVVRRGAGDASSCCATSLVKNAADVGAHLMAGATALMDKHPLIGDVRGRGLMIGIELVRDRADEGARHQASATRSCSECFKRGLLVLGAGRNAIRFSPPLVLTKAAGRHRARASSTRR